MSICACEHQAECDERLDISSRTNNMYDNIERGRSFDGPAIEI